MTQDQQVLCATTAYFIRTYRVVAALGLICTALGLFVLLQLLGSSSIGNGAVLVAALVIVLGIIERYWALRLQFDSDLFYQISVNAQFELPLMDSAMNRLGLRKQGETRDLNSRIDGTLRLYKLHIVCVAIQMALVIFCGLV
jgi:hypothetical protein